MVPIVLLPPLPLLLLPPNCTFSSLRIMDGNIGDRKGGSVAAGVTHGTCAVETCGAPKSPAIVDDNSTRGLII